MKKLKNNKTNKKQKNGNTKKLHNKTKIQENDDSKNRITKT